MNNKTKQIISEYVEKNKGKLFAILSDLIKINSENFGTHGNEKEIAFFISDKLKELNIENCVYSPDNVSHILEHRDYLCGRNMAERYNVTGCLKGKDSKEKVMLAAHIDTVPIGDRALWSVDPLGGEIKDGRIWGRGACDDKYGVAAVIFIFKMLKDLNLSLEHDLYFTGYADEEFGGGNGALAACLKYPCDAVVNLDCKNMKIWNVACGGRRETLTLKKDGVCDACDEMIEAIYIAKEELHAFGENRKKELSENPNFAGTIIPDKSMRILCLESGMNTNDRNTAHIDFSYYTDKTEKEIKAELDLMVGKINERTKAFGVYVEKLTPKTRYFRYALSDRDNEYTEILKNGAKGLIADEITEEASCLSDLNIFINNGSKKSFSFGVGRDFNVEGGAHLANEFIECDSLVDFTKAVAAFVCDWGKVQGGI